VNEYPGTKLVFPSDQQPAKPLVPRVTFKSALARGPSATEYATTPLLAPQLIVLSPVHDLAAQTLSATRTVGLLVPHLQVAEMMCNCQFHVRSHCVTHE
jgi:hypothetical protein